MDIYKEHVIEALEDEPLAWGKWVDIPVEDIQDIHPLMVIRNVTPEIAREYSGCTVCVVGSVFRKYSKSTGSIGRLIGDQLIGDADPGPKNGGIPWEAEWPENWITVLSWVWEGLDNFNEDLGIEEARTIMIDWVEDNVPEDEILFTV